MKNLILMVMLVSVFFQSSFASIGENKIEDGSELGYSHEVASFDSYSTLQNSTSYSPSEPIYKAPYKSAALAAGMSIFVPGMGHAYIGDMKTAGCLIGGVGCSFGAGSLGKDPAVHIPGSCLMSNTWMYGVYAAYRDARIFNGASHYSYKKMPHDSLFDLATAPFRLSILKKPEVWGGVLCKLTAGIGVLYLYSQMAMHSGIPVHSSRGSSVMPFMAFPIGIGEEALFRGYLQPQISEAFGSPAAGLILSSFAFGGAHLLNTLNMDEQDRRDYCTYSIPFLICSGFYYGWLANKNCSLKEAVAVHALYDFTLFGLGAAFGGEDSIWEKHDFSMSIPF